MKRFLSLALYLICIGAYAQNLVVNGSFERDQEAENQLPRQVKSCAFTGSPEDFNLYLHAWHTFRLTTPDLLQTDSNCALRLPTPRTGKRMLGLIMYHPGMESEHEYDYHEYVEGRLARSLTPGKRYRVSVWVQEAKGAGEDHLRNITGSRIRIQPVNCNNFGFYFATESSNRKEDIRRSIFTYGMKPQVNFTEIVMSEAGGWKKLSAVFTPSQPFRYFIFGNFFSDGVTLTDLSESEQTSIEANNIRESDHLKKIKRIAYYCFDDFSLVEESANATPAQTPPAPANDMARRLIRERKVAFSATLLFDVDRSDLKPGAFAQLDSLAEALRQYKDIRIEIGGHTDQTGKIAYNQKLSERRAEAVRQYLILKGINPERLAAKGYGDAVPVAPNDTSEGRSANRRVECKVL